MASVCNRIRQQALLFKWLEAVEAMKAFFTQRLSSNEKLRTYLEQADSDLAATKKAVIDGAKLLKEAEEEREVAKVEVCRMKEERETAQVKCKDVE